MSSAADTDEPARWLAPASLFAAVVIGRALQIDNGAYSVEAVFWLAAALAVALAATTLSRPADAIRVDVHILPVLFLGGLVVNITQLLTAEPGGFSHFGPGQAALFNGGVAAIGVLGFTTLWRAPRLVGISRIVLFVALHFALGAMVIHAAHRPAIDVDVFHRESIEALRHGVNPYGITFPNIYGDSLFYGPGMSVDGRLQFGFPYPPLSLLLAMPGQLLLGDHRFAQLVALELAAVFMATARPGRFSTFAAVLFLTTPRLFFVLEESWTEPFLVLGLAALVWAACRDSRAVPWLFGAFLGLKQYLVLAVPAAFLLLPRPVDRERVVNFFGKAALVALLITVPFFAWAPGAFWKSVVTLQFHQPFRLDALTFLAWWVRFGHAPPPAFVPFAAAGIVVSLLMWRVPKTPAGFAAATAVTFLVFFAFNKQAFCNYYFFVIGSFCVTLAAWQAPLEAR